MPAAQASTTIVIRKFRKMTTWLRAFFEPHNVRIDPLEDPAQTVEPRQRAEALRSSRQMS